MHPRMWVYCCVHVRVSRQQFLASSRVRAHVSHAYASGIYLSYTNMRTNTYIQVWKHQRNVHPNTPPAIDVLRVRRRTPDQFRRRSGLTFPWMQIPNDDWHAHTWEHRCAVWAQWGHESAGSCTCYTDVHVHTYVLLYLFYILFKCLHMQMKFIYTHKHIPAQTCTIICRDMHTHTLLDTHACILHMLERNKCTIQHTAHTHTCIYV